MNKIQAAGTGRALGRVRKDVTEERRIPIEVEAIRLAAKDLAAAQERTADHRSAKADVRRHTCWQRGMGGWEMLPGRSTDRRLQCRERQVATPRADKLTLSRRPGTARIQHSPDAPPQGDDSSCSASVPRATSVFAPRQPRACQQRRMASTATCFSALLFPPTLVSRCRCTQGCPQSSRVTGPHDGQLEKRAGVRAQGSERLQCRPAPCLAPAAHHGALWRARARASTLSCRCGSLAHHGRFTVASAWKARDASIPGVAHAALWSPSGSRWPR
ncbi:unnamed protein product [Symbiodinium natans]|uniref:Uncharacterized protein n=1 Tax=Symbiodinium natans TaxID=878477 RepID=A0A812JZA8_9DINO|nr:unnamed protein product [Symbiodinium natans]